MKTGPKAPVPKAGMGPMQKQHGMVGHESFHINFALMVGVCLFLPLRLPGLPLLAFSP